MRTGSPNWLKPLATTRSARGVSNCSPGNDRQPSGPVLHLAGEVEVGVDEVSELAVDPVGEDPQADPDLRCGQPGARGVDHRVGEVADELAQLPVEVDDRLGRRPQHGVAEEADVLDRHAGQSRDCASAADVGRVDAHRHRDGLLVGAAHPPQGGQGVGEGRALLERCPEQIAHRRLVRGQRPQGLDVRRQLQGGQGLLQGAPGCGQRRPCAPRAAAAAPGARPARARRTTPGPTAPGPRPRESWCGWVLHTARRHPDPPLPCRARPRPASGAQTPPPRSGRGGRGWPTRRAAARRHSRPRRPARRPGWR